MARKNSAQSAAFGAAVRAVRMDRGYSQEGLAARAGIDRSYCGAIERGGVQCLVQHDAEAC
ncbi:MAG TPA: helix-turn-helix transcriptional regulator [Solirubrobacteraceae bacterium]|nr:helix-turn-helix transcriptional regulator [Solirubrobacteraceae bacterium]